MVPFETRKVRFSCYMPLCRKEIRNHLQKIHGYPMEVMHLKIDRNNPSEIDSKWHWSGNI